MGAEVEADEGGEPQRVLEWPRNEVSEESAEGRSRRMLRAERPAALK